MQLCFLCALTLFRAADALLWALYQADNSGNDASFILNHIQIHYASVTLSDLAGQFHYSEKQISRIVQNCMGLTYHQLILKLRMEKAAGMLQQQSAPIETIASAVGYTTVSSFYRAFIKYFGCTPGNYVTSSKS